jgi:hypothetical protein
MSTEATMLPQTTQSSTLSSVWTKQPASVSASFPFGTFAASRRLDERIKIGLTFRDDHWFDNNHLLALE